MFLTTLLNMGYHASKHWIFVPFLFMVIASLFSVMRQLSIVGNRYQDGNGVVQEIMSLIIKLFLAFFVYLFFVVPGASLTTSNLNYTPRATFLNENPDVATPTASGDPTALYGSFNTIDNFFADIKLPYGWDLIGRVSSGFTFAIATGLGQSVDLEESMTSLTTSVITDPQLANEVPSFYGSCYKPARSKLSEWMVTDRVTPALRNRINDYGEADLSYLGSKTLLETEGLYKRCTNLNTCQGSLRSRYPVASFPYSAARDSDYTEQDISNNVPGKPYCDEWWTSIETRILAEEPVAATGTIEGIANYFGFTGDDELTQARVQRVLANSQVRSDQLLGQTPGSYFGDGQAALDQAAVEQQGAGAAVGVAALGASVLNPIRKATLAIAGAEAGFTALNAYQNFRKMAYLKRAVPIMIAILLFVVPLIIPFALLWKAYGIDMVITMGITYFSIRFMTALYEIGVFLQNTIQQTVFSNFGNFASYLASNGVIGGAETLLTLSFIIPTLFMVIPLIFIILAGRIGIAVGLSAR